MLEILQLGFLLTWKIPLENYRNILIENLDCNGFRGVNKNWLFVAEKLNRCNFSDKPVSNGFSRGSVLEPQLYQRYFRWWYKYASIRQFTKKPAKSRNYNLKNLSQWLKGNKFALDVTKRINHFLLKFKQNWSFS